MEVIYTKLKNYRRRLAAFIVMIMAMALSAHAGGTSTTYYYRATANISPTGAGKVYVATTATDNPSYQSSNQTISGNQRSVDAAQVTFYYYAQANTNYIFDHWAKGSASGESVSTNSSFSTTETVTSTNQNSPTSFSYYAVFKQQTGLVKVYSEDVNKGTVSINKSDNAIGDNVTLTASPDISNGVTFLGWRKGSATTGDYVSTDKEYSFTVSSETQGNYYACFSNPLERVYIRMKNKATGRFISMYGNTRASNHQGDMNGNTFNDGYVFTNSLKMIDASDAQGNPSTVFLRAGTPSMGSTTGANLVAHGVSYKEDLVDTSHLLTMNQTADGTYTISTKVTFNDSGNQVNFTSYLFDEGGNNSWAVMKTGEISDNSKWYIYVLTENTDEGAFGANTKAKFTKDGKYYTTMFTDFPYQLLDGVKAYYLPATDTTSYDEETNLVTFTEVTTGKVPANTAVVLECVDVQANVNAGTVKNRLVPLDENVASVVGESANLLKGYVSINGATRANNQSLMYVLTVSSNTGVLGFYHYSKATMTPNKAYLELPESIDNNPQLQNVKFSFGNKYDPTDVKLHPQTVSDDEAVYDLSGRKVADDTTDMKKLPKGIYVSGGKKIILK